MPGGLNIISFSLWILPVFALFAYCGIWDLWLMVYVVAILHEMGHLLVSKILGYTNSGIKIDPFGVYLKLNDNISNSLHEFFISMAGPFANFIMLAVSTLLMYVGINIPKAFFVSNLYMLFINLLPVHPLDGGRIMKSILKMEMGEKKTQKIMGYISIPVVCVVAVVGVLLLFKSKINASLLLASVFMCNKIKIVNNKQENIAQLYSFKIDCDKVKSFYINANSTVKEAIKILPFENMIVVFVTNDEGQIIKTTTNKYILGLGTNNLLNCKMSDI